MGDTTNYDLRWPEGTEAANVPQDIRDLAEDVENYVGILRGTLAARPAATAVKAQQEYVATDVQRRFRSTGTVWREVVEVAEGDVSTLAATGDIKMSARTTAPTGWILCDGTAITAASGLTALRNALLADGSPYGVVGTDPKVPDLRGSVPVMPDGTAGRMASNDAIGNRGGAERVTLAATESGVAVHGHADTIAVASGGAGTSGAMSANASHSHTPGTGGREFGTAQPGDLLPHWSTAFGTGSYHWHQYVDNNTNTVNLDHTHTTPNHTHPKTGGVTNHAGAAAAASHQNMPPYQVVNFFIKT